MGTAPNHNYAKYTVEVRSPYYMAVPCPANDGRGCTRFQDFSTISSFKLEGMFFGLVLMFVAKEFVWRRFVTQICANYGTTHIQARICTTKRCQTKFFGTSIQASPKNMPTNLEPKLLPTVKTEARYCRKTLKSSTSSFIVRRAWNSPVDHIY